MAEWLQLKIARFGELSSVEEKQDILTEIKIKLRSLNNIESEQVSRSLDFGQLFTQLTSNDRYHDIANSVETLKYIDIIIKYQ